MWAPLRRRLCGSLWTGTHKEPVAEVGTSIRPWRSGRRRTDATRLIPVRGSPTTFANRAFSHHSGS